ncbi:MAG: hypothetical protein OEY89_04565 [Gammaproteobacteria bacterium]|nr:hypothetical protein [Gammaproteobacteria bacterium]
MFIAIFETRSPTNTTTNIVKIWINTDDINSAQTIALNRLNQEGIEVTSTVEIIETDKGDYFPPCSSLDAFMQAELEGIAVLYS